MAKLTAKQRRALPKSQFGLPEERRYPIPDEDTAKEQLDRVAGTGNRREQRLVRTAVETAFPKLANGDDDNG
ncbi:MAG: hypothetical protein WAU42_14710 [Solirubrobacteraceae bacterium]